MEDLQALRRIAEQVDDLLHTLFDGENGSGSGSTSAPLPLSAAPDRSTTELLRDLLGLGSTPALHERIVTAALELTGGERTFLMLLEGSKLRFKAGRGVDHRALAGKEFAGVRVLIKEILQGGRAICLRGNDLPAHGLIHLQGVLVAPLKLGRRTEGQDRVQGAIYVDCVQQASLDQPQLSALELLCDYAAVALENRQVLERQEGSSAAAEPLASRGSEVLRLRENIARVYQVGQSINSTLILDEVLVNIVDHVVEVSRAERGFVMLLEEGGEPVYKVGRDAQRRTVPEERFPYSTTVTRRTINERRPVILAEPVGSDLSLSIEKLELQSIMCVPLKEKEEVFGLVYVDSRQQNREFAQSDLEVVESLCGQASVAIVNAKLYREAGERQRLTHELQLAARLQRELLPAEIPQVEGLEVFGTLIPALEVGGDYYDFVPHPEDPTSLTMAIGDVSGKGVYAGIVMAMARSALRSLVQHQGEGGSPLAVMRSLNYTLCRDIPPEMFMTLNLLRWDGAARKLVYCSAGHEYLLVYRADQDRVEAIKAGGVACGVLAEASDMLKETELQLAPGDHVLLYTDGATEAMNEDHQPYGRDGLEALLASHGEQSPQALCEALLATLAAHQGEARPHDDITLVAFKLARD